LLWNRLLRRGRLPSDPDGLKGLLGRWLARLLHWLLGRLLRGRLRRLICRLLGGEQRRKAHRGYSSSQ
jgi:hypothetical protein